MNVGILRSSLDASVNFVEDELDGGALESRFVQRAADKILVYLSSHSGCKMACRMCHLTATGQTMMAPAALQDYRRQAERVLAYYDTLIENTGQAPAKVVNYNFMARGEPLANPTVLGAYPDLRRCLSGLAQARGLAARLNVSTILPKDMEAVRLQDVFAGEPVHLFYSLYSMKPAFRRRWLPRALDPRIALDKLADWQLESSTPITLHWAFIAGENDDEDTVGEIIDAVRSRALRVKFNAVRYNPHSEAHGREPDEEILQRNFRVLAEAFGHPESQMVPRVGFDIKASCGMFVTPAQNS